MLKRTQVMLNGWLVDYVKTIGTDYGISFSEVARLGLCVHFLKTISLEFPEFQPKFTANDLAAMLAKRKSKTVTEDEFNRFVTDVYFETRKATEYHASKK